MIKKERGARPWVGWLGSVDIGREGCQVWYVRLMRVHAEYLGVAWIFWRKEGREEAFGGYVHEPETKANHATNRRLLQGQNDLPAQLPSIPAQDEVRDSDLPPQR
jgi:hypothetical protein